MRYVGFIRNVMLGRQGLHRVVLLECLATVGAGDPVSYFTTGNIGFDTDDVEALIEALETEIAGIIGRREPVVVRTVDALARIVAADPFAACPWEDPVERVVSFSRQRFAVPERLPVLSRRGDCCVFRVDGTEAYGASRMVNGRTSGAGGLAEWVAGSPITTRSWGTVTKVSKKEFRSRSGPRTGKKGACAARSGGSGVEGIPSPSER